MNQTLVWGSSFALCAVLLTTVYNATNPEYNFPGIVETLLIGVSFLLVANSFFLGKTLTSREWILVGILLLLIGTLAIRYLLGWSDQESLPSRKCMWMPGYFAKLECFLQLPFKSNHGLRQLLFHLTALAVFIATACLSRMSGTSRPWLIIPLAIPALIVAIGIIIQIYHDPNFSLTGYNFVFNTLEIIRGKGVVANPSWLWPWLTPVMGIGLAFMFEKNWVLKGFGLSIFIICAWASLSVMQRGGYLIVGVFITILMILLLYLLGKNWSKKYALILGGVGAIGLGYILYYPSKILDILRPLTHLGIKLRESGFLYSNNRLIIWDSAIQSIKEHPWIGTGYGTWLKEFSKILDNVNLTFDTAHNLWIQLIFELGAIHSFIIVLVLVSITIPTLIYKNISQSSLQIGGFFLVIGFFVVSLVQEIDYILPIYMQFCVFAGLCFGGTSYHETDLHEKRNYNKKPWYLLGCGILTISGALFYWSSISWGGYGFDPTSNAFSRWFRPEGVIAAAPDRLGKDYSLYWGKLGKLNLENFSNSGAFFPDIWTNGNTLYLKNGSRFNPIQYEYKSQEKVMLPQRIASFELNQPPGQTNVLLLGQKGMYNWELSGGFKKGIKTGRWCEKSCIMLIYRPKGGNKPHGVSFKMPLPGLNEKHPVKLTVTMQAYTGSASTQYFKDLTQQTLNAQIPESAASKDYIFTNPENSFPLPVNFKKHQFWLISLKTDRTIVPKEYDPESTDSRKLGVRVLF